jgi:hypothetical protein
MSCQLHIRAPEDTKNSVFGKSTPIDLKSTMKLTSQFLTPSFLLSTFASLQLLPPNSREISYANWE